MFRVTRYPMISKTELGRVGYRKKYRVGGRIRVPAQNRGGRSNPKKKVTDLGATPSTRTEQICKVVYDPFSSFTIIAEVEEGFLTLLESIYLGHG